MIGMLSAIVHKLNRQLDAYDRCMKKSNDSSFCSSRLSARDQATQSSVVDAFSVALFISVIWLLVSIAGIFIGGKGAAAEETAKHELSSLHDVTPIRAQAIPVIEQPNIELREMTASGGRCADGGGSNPYVSVVIASPIDTKEYR